MQPNVRGRRPGNRDVDTDDGAHDLGHAELAARVVGVGVLERDAGEMVAGHRARGHRDA